MAALNKHWLQILLMNIMVWGIHCTNESTSTLPITYSCPPKLQECDCPIGKQLIFSCPQTKTNQPLLFNLRYDLPNAQLTMECVGAAIDYSLLNLDKFEFPRVHTFVLYECPMPNISIKSVLEGFNVTMLKIKPQSTIEALHSYLFQNASQIEHLDIEGGNIRVIENGSFKDLTSLRTLKISQTALTLIPESTFHEMSSLLRLNLDSNMIEELPANAFEKLTLLQNLSLNSNRIRNLNESVFQNLVSLRSLTVSNNMLDSLSPNIFQTLTKLEFVDLTNTNLTKLPEELFQNNPQLLTILLKMNPHLSNGNLPARLFQHTVLLQKLEIDQNNLREMPKDLLSALPNLSILNLSRNRLQNLPTGLFDDNKKLREIDLSVNQLTALPDNLFQDHTELKIVNLHNNKLSVVSKLLFSELPTLDILDLSDNKISVIDELAFEGSDNVTSLDLSYNNLSFDHEAFSIPQNIKYLNFSHNNLTNFPEHEWHNVPHILLINLTDNHLASLNVPQLMFKSKKVTVDMRRNEIHTVNLENLDIYYTPSTNKPDVPSTISIPNIFIEENPINCDCNLLSFVRYVKRYNDDIDKPFRFHANSLECASPNDPMLWGRKLSSITEDNLYCLIDDLCDEHCVCKRSSVSQTLTVECLPGPDNAKLHEFPKTAPTNTSKLLLQNNNIVSMSVMKEKLWRNLTEVYLSGNALVLDDIPVHLPDHLRMLELTNNKVEYMPQWLMTEVSYRNDLSLALGGNPWRCDCTAVKFHQWLKDLPVDKVSDRGSVKCGNGSHANEKLLDLRLSKFCIHHRAGPSGPILVTVFSALVLLGVAVIAGVLLTRNRHRIKMWCFRHKMCLWMRTPDDIEAGHPL